MSPKALTGFAGTGFTGPAGALLAFAIPPFLPAFALFSHTSLYLRKSLSNWDLKGVNAIFNRESPDSNSSYSLLSGSSSPC